MYLALTDLLKTFLLSMDNNSSLREFQINGTLWGGSEEENLVRGIDRNM